MWSPWQRRTIVESNYRTISPSIPLFGYSIFLHLLYSFLSSIFPGLVLKQKRLSRRRCAAQRSSCWQHTYNTSRVLSVELVTTTTSNERRSSPVPPFVLCDSAVHLHYRKPKLPADTPTLTNQLTSCCYYAPACSHLISSAGCVCEKERVSVYQGVGCVFFHCNKKKASD